MTTRVTFAQVGLDPSGGAAIRVDTGAKGHIHTNTVNGPASGPGSPEMPAAGIEFHDSADDSTIIGNTIARTAAGIDINGASGGIIRDNKVTGGQTAYDLFDGDDMSIHDNTTSGRHVPWAGRGRGLTPQQRPRQRFPVEQERHGQGLQGRQRHGYPQHVDPQQGQQQQARGPVHEAPASRSTDQGRPRHRRRTVVRTTDPTRSVDADAWSIGLGTLHRGSLVLDRRRFLQLAAATGLAVAATSAAQGAASGQSAAPSMAPTSDPIADLATSLGHDPEAIFRFVQDEVRYEPYAGLLRGATATLLGRAGNSVDQAALLAELLRSGARRCVSRWVPSTPARHRSS